ncbi:MAG: AraC family transcriptional regulator [Clostridia bacterium]|nr:AraC family transcriptional regulator [Clostridia bacterium]
MFFEPKHSLSENEFSLGYEKEFHFPLHIHRAFECYIQIEGTADVRVEDRVYHLSAGEAVLAFPYQPHAYDCSGKHAICIFSPDLCADFSKKTAHTRPSDNFFRHTIREGTRTDHLYFRKAFVYELCGAFDIGRTYNRHAHTLDNDLLTALLLYAEENFRTDCLLQSAAASVGYDYAYVSKFFKRKVGMSFRRYVNLLRVNEAGALLRSTAMHVSEIGDACGFSCLRTFDRAFLEVTGMTPQKYRAEKETAVSNSILETGTP